MPPQHHTTAPVTLASETVRRFDNLTPARALRLPLAFSLGLLLFGFVPIVRENAAVLWSVWGAVGVLLIWRAALHVGLRKHPRPLAVDVVLRRPHYLQTLVQGALLTYWGWYWPPVYEYAPLIAAQLVLAYTVDMLLTWSRRERYALGFGPFPIVFSISFFLWFKVEWFYWQFVLVAFAMFAKEMIRWERDGRRTHIFNPSNFPLAVFAVVLIATGTTGLTWGEDIATTLDYPPNIYLVVFLAGLVGQFFFGVTTMTMSAIVTTYLFSEVYFRVTGTYFFFDSHIPIAVFLGMHLLFTDPATSPRTELGRILYGIGYGVSVVALYAALTATGTPTFYDKLLFVPILNLAAKSIDAFARSGALKAIDPGRLAVRWINRPRHLAYMSLWTMFFVAMSIRGGLGDEHPGGDLPFWQQACESGRTNGCRNLATMLARYCRNGSGWACNEIGLLAAAGREGVTAPAPQAFSRSCRLRFEPGCANDRSLAQGRVPDDRASPALDDYRVIVRPPKGKAAPTPDELLKRACDQGFAAACR